MTIDEQIKFCEEKIENIKLKTEPQTFVDIKEMLEAFKELKQEEYDNTQFQLMAYADGYNKAIDDFVNALRELFEDEDYMILDNCEAYISYNVVLSQIAEQLKEGK